MSISHRTNRLKLVGTPSVEKLQNGRYKLTVTCSTMNSREDWYSANKARIFPDFGSLQSAEMSIDGLSPRTGEAYADMRLTQIESGNRSARDGGDYLVALTYETLGSSFIQVKDDNTDYELNGLRRVTRTSIAEAGTDYARTVGTSFIDHQIDSETAVRCFLSSYGIDDTDSFRQVQEVYVEAGILSLQQEFNNGLKQVSVQAFGMTATEVSTELAVITTGHELISQNESDYEGIKTSTFQYQIDESITEDYELNGLRSLSITELSSTNFTAQSIGVAGAAATPQAGLYLGAQDIDNGGAIKVRESVWFEDGTLDVQRVSESDGVYRVTTTFLGVEGDVVGPIIARTEGDFEGLKTITVVSMQDASGASLINDTLPVASHSILNEFTYPGVVSISAVTLDGTGNTYKFFARDFYLNPPTVARVPATIKVSFKTTSTISYSALDGLWNPTTWATGTSLGIGWNYLPFSISRGFRGYRVPQGEGVINGYAGLGTSGPFYMISGRRIFANTNWSIAVSGGPDDPVGKNYTLDYSVSLAFEDTAGNSYYKHTEIVSTIPSR